MIADEIIYAQDRLRSVHRDLERLRCSTVVGDSTRHSLMPAVTDIASLVRSLDVAVGAALREVRDL